MKTIARWKKAAFCLLLAVALITVNVGGQLKAAMAADYYDLKIFELESRAVYIAIQEAIDNGERIASGDIEFTNGKIGAYRALFYGENVKKEEHLTYTGQEETDIVEFHPQYEGDMDGEVRFFVRLPEEADSDYRVTGEEQIILLYINNTDETLKFSVSIDGRRGKSVVIEGYEPAFGEDEVEFISGGTKQDETSEARESTENEKEQESASSGERTEEETERDWAEGGEIASEESESQSAEGTEASEEIGETAKKNIKRDHVETGSGERSKKEVATASISLRSAALVKAVLEAEELENGGSSEKERDSYGKESSGKDIIPEKGNRALKTADTSAGPEENRGVRVTANIGVGESEKETEDEPRSHIPVATQTEASREKPEKEKQQEEGWIIRSGKYPLVGINGCSTSKAYVTDWKGLGVDIEGLETGFFWEEELEEGVTVRLGADQSASEVLTSLVTADIREVPYNVKEAIGEKRGVGGRDVIVYEIDLYDEKGELIDSSNWDGYVKMSFFGERLERLAESNAALDVIHVKQDADITSGDVSPEELELEVVETVVPYEKDGLVSASIGGLGMCGVIPSSKRDLLIEPGGEGGITKIEGRPSYCISPWLNYPETEEHIKAAEYYEADLEEIEQDEYFRKVNWELIGVIIELGYPMDEYWDSEHYSKKEKWEGTRQAIWWVLGKKDWDEIKEIGESPDLPEFMKMGVELYERALERWGEIEAPLKVQVSEREGVFKKSEENGKVVWVTGPITVISSQRDFEITKPAEGIGVELQKEGSWSPLEEAQYQGIPSESVIRFVSEVKPESGTVEIKVKKTGVPGDYGFHYYKAGGERRYQTLLTIEINKSEVSALETITLRSDASEDNSSGGGTPDEGPTGGGSTGGGSSGRQPTGSGQRVPSLGGPGAVELMDGDVPLAPLPPVPESFITILDGDVPLSPLPKTGEGERIKENVFILSGIMLAIYTFLSKKKNKAA